jgi:hypothetical protein
MEPCVFALRMTDKITKQAPKESQGVVVYLLWSWRLAFVVMMTHPLSADRISRGHDLHLTQNNKVACKNKDAPLIRSTRVQ